MLFVGAGAIATPAEGPHLLNEALKNVSQDMSRWAYTEAIVQKDSKGKIKKETVVRVDPSRPYVEQYRLLSVGGKEPTEKQQREYRRRGEKAGEAAERKERGLPQSSKRRSQKVGDLVALDKSVVTAEDAQSITYEVPLRKDDNNRFPPEKFLVLARVNKEQRAIENVSVKLREPLRAKLILKIKSGDAVVDFTSVDPKFAPVMSSVEGDAVASILFVNVGGSLELKRTDFKRVKPYNDRFDVEIGPSKALDF